MLAGMVSDNSLHYLKRVSRHLNHPAFTQMWLGWTFSTASLVGLPTYQLTLTHCLFSSFTRRWNYIGSVFQTSKFAHGALALLELIFSGELWVVPANHLHQSDYLKRQRAESRNLDETRIQSYPRVQVVKWKKNIPKSNILHYYGPLLSAEKCLIYFWSALSLIFNLQKWKLLSPYMKGLGDRKNKIKIFCSRKQYP